MRALGQVAELLRRGARAEVAAVEAALELRFGRGEPNSKLALREPASDGGAAWISVSGAFTFGSHWAVRIVSPQPSSEPVSFS